MGSVSERNKNKRSMNAPFARHMSSTYLSESVLRTFPDSKIFKVYYLTHPFVVSIPFWKKGCSDLKKNYRKIIYYSYYSVNKTVLMV